MGTKIAPSLLSADFGKLAAEIDDVTRGGADWLHLDVMDGHFVPNLTFGQPVIKSLRAVSSLPFDVHLMVEDPDSMLESFAAAGADWLTVHVETCPHLHRTLERIRKLGCKAGVSLNPATPLAQVEEVIELADLILVMTVNPGFGGQEFIARAASKLERLRRLSDERQPECLLQVDGGVGEQNAGRLITLGADVLVAGSEIFGKSDREEAIRRLRSAADLAYSARRPSGRDNGA